MRQANYDELLVRVLRRALQMKWDIRLVADDPAIVAGPDARDVAEDHGYGEQ